MKTSMVTLLLAMAATCAVCTEKHAVLDSDGEPLRPGAEYFIVPASGGNAGGLVPASRDLLHVCTLDIVQALLPSQPGLPVSFILSEETVRLSKDLSIQFKSSIWVCPSSKVWKVDYSTSEDVYNHRR
ncbi:PREDICTED: cysteine protease inhibitor WSCP-like [Tarenaya hassleriana]|uniref:cysteine protease inhibitor WSCP-like n=1 Tax=Tarenaya hassleriana TaxID=28532 RepID=UPI00053C5956|nr:PREDICTED: cysteine protease inhibitor WSCP-like [Tarenaya hassleriana]